MENSDLHAVALRAAEGNEGAFAELRGACEPTVRSYLDHKIRDQALVPGLMDVVFEVARRGVAKYPSSALQPRHWLLRVARWVVVRYYEFSSRSDPRP